MENIKRFLIRSKYGLFLFGMAFVVAIGLLGGTSYALWKLNFTQTDPNVVSTACFDMTFTELTPSVNLQNAYPISDENGLETTPYTFKIANTCTQYGTYVIRLDILNTSTMSEDKIKIQLEGASSISPTVLSTLENNTLLEPGISSSKVIVSDSLYEQEEKEYSLRIWIDSSAGNEIMNQEFKANIVIEMIASHEPQFLATNYFDNPRIAKANVAVISFTTSNKVPAGVKSQWDAGEVKNGKVMAWYTVIDGKNHVTIGAEGGVYAPVNSTGLFYGFYSLNSLDLTNLDTSKVENMSYMFSNAGRDSGGITLNLGDRFDTSKVTNMESMFGEFRRVLAIDFGNKFDTSNVINMMLMFYNCGSETPNFTLDLGDKFDTSRVTTMENMFYNTGWGSTVFTLDLGDKFTTSNVTTMMQMFTSTGYSSPIFTLNLGNNFNTSNVTTMYWMFSGTGYSNPNFVLDIRSFNFIFTPDRYQNIFTTSNSSHKLYATDANIRFTNNQNFTGTIINCTTNPTSCP